MTERLPGVSSEKPERGSPQEIINEYNEAKELIIWLLTKGSSADPALKKQKRYRLNSIFMKHELSLRI